MIQVHKGLRLAVESALCPYCRSWLTDFEDLVRCSFCETSHHKSCWNENGSHCSVFSCPGLAETQVKRAKWVRFGVLFHCSLNILVNFFIHSIRPLVDYFSVPDALALLLLQGTIIATGIVVLARFHPESEDDVRDSSLKSIAAMVLSSNVLFVLLLLLYLLQQGLQSLLALISF